MSYTYNIRLRDAIGNEINSSNQTFKTIGESISLSESQVSRIYKGAIKKMKRIIEKDQEA